MKKLVFLIPIFFISCSTKQLEKTTSVTITDNPLKQFFQQCESDISRAKKVVIERDLVKNLTHLQKMNYGGRKYYLLERESITRMIKAVTKGVYKDFILINKEGKIIYTMKNDNIFGKNVNTSLKSSILKQCYDNRDISTFIGDVSILNPDMSNFYIVVSSKVKGENTFPGIFVMQIDISKIEEVIRQKFSILDHDGNYRIVGDRIRIFTPYLEFKKIDLSLSGDNSQSFSFLNSQGNNIKYRFFNFNNLRWILVAE